MSSQLWAVTTHCFRRQAAFSDWASLQLSCGHCPAVLPCPTLPWPPGCPGGFPWLLPACSRVSTCLHRPLGQQRWVGTPSKPSSVASCSAPGSPRPRAAGGPPCSSRPTPLCPPTHTGFDGPACGSVPSGARTCPSRSRNRSPVRSSTGSGEPVTSCPQHPQPHPPALCLPDEHGGAWLPSPLCCPREQHRPFQNSV